jgi:hypothetical protein
MGTHIFWVRGQGTQVTLRCYEILRSPTAFLPLMRSSARSILRCALDEAGIS